MRLNGTMGGRGAREKKGLKTSRIREGETVAHTKKKLSKKKETTENAW